MKKKLQSLLIGLLVASMVAGCNSKVSNNENESSSLNGDTSIAVQADKDKSEAGTEETASDNQAGAAEKATADSASKETASSNDASRLFETVTTTVKESDSFGDIILDIQKIDLDYGDSVNVDFSGGYSMKEIPFYPDFYGKKGGDIITDFYDDITIAGIGYNLNVSANVQVGETVTITIDKRAKYLNEYNAYNVDPDIEKWEGQTDEAFINARMVTSGDIRDGVLYRGSSPFNKKFNRVELMSKYIQENDIKCIVNLTDTEEDLAKMDDLPENISKMLDEGNVITCELGITFNNPESMKGLAECFRKMNDKEGPYLVHCLLGRDRTGVICALLEALCGASYDEIIDGYMLSYKELHGIDMNPENLQYTLFKQRIDDKLEEIFEIEQSKIPKTDLKAAAEDYLTRCGMSEEEINKLRDSLTTE